MSRVERGVRQSSGGGEIPNFLCRSDYNEVYATGDAVWLSDDKIDGFIFVLISFG